MVTGRKRVIWLTANRTCVIATNGVTQGVSAAVRHVTPSGATSAVSKVASFQKLSTYDRYAYVYNVISNCEIEYIISITG